MNPYDTIRDLNDEVNKLTRQLEVAKASLSKWEDVFGHLGTPDEVGNEWHAIIERADRLEKVEAALRIAVQQNSHDMLMTGDELRQCETALEEVK